MVTGKTERCCEKNLIDNVDVSDLGDLEASLKHQISDRHKTHVLNIFNSSDILCPNQI